MACATSTSFIELKRKPAYKNLFIDSGFNNIVFLSNSKRPCVISNVISLYDEENVCDINSSYINNISNVFDKAN